MRLSYSIESSFCKSKQNIFLRAFRAFKSVVCLLSPVLINKGYTRDKPTSINYQIRGYKREIEF